MQQVTSSTNNRVELHYRPDMPRSDNPTNHGRGKQYGDEAGESNESKHCGVGRTAANCAAAVCTFSQERRCMAHLHTIMERAHSIEPYVECRSVIARIIFT